MHRDPTDRLRRAAASEIPIDKTFRTVPRARRRLASSLNGVFTSPLGNQSCSESSPFSAGGAASESAWPCSLRRPTAVLRPADLPNLRSPGAHPSRSYSSRSIWLRCIADPGPCLRRFTHDPVPPLRLLPPRDASSPLPSSSTPNPCSLPTALPLPPTSPTRQLLRLPQQPSPALSSPTPSRPLATPSRP